MRTVSSLFLLYLGASAFFVTIISNMDLPSSYLTKGPNFQFIPIIICIVNLIFAVYSIFKRKNFNRPPAKQPTFFRWILIAIGVFIFFCGFTSFSVSLYSPFLFGSNEPVPQVGVISSFIMALMLSAILHFTSKMNTAQQPNLFRYISMIVAFLAANINLVQCLMLIYAVPVQPPTAYPFLSELLTIAFIPFSLVILTISKSYVAVE